MPTAFSTASSCRVPFVKVASDQELHGGAPPELEASRPTVAPTAGGEVFPRRLRAMPGVRQGIRKRDPQPALLGVVPRPQLESQAVEPGGADERQGLLRLRGRLRVIHPRARASSRRRGNGRPGPRDRPGPTTRAPAPSGGGGPPGTSAGCGRPRPRGRGRGRSRSRHAPPGRCCGSAGRTARAVSAFCSLASSRAARDASAWSSGRPETATTSRRRCASSGKRRTRAQSTSSKASSSAPGTRCKSPVSPGRMRTSSVMKNGLPPDSRAMAAAWAAAD